MTLGPYHEAELALQRRTGREGLAGTLASRVSDVVTAEAAELLRTLPYVVAGSLDARGRPWASIITGPPGFVVPGGPALEIRSRPHEADPLRANLDRTGEFAMLGIDLSRRRRYRINGTAALGPDGIAVRVAQCYRNCPQYINMRRARPALERRPARGAPPRTSPVLDAASAAAVGAADTFFIATHATGFPTGDPRLGADVSHRGGNPGFVAVSEGGRSVSFPDYVGNFMFNTLGNLARHPRCGLLFLDFETGSTIQVTGSASVDWDLERSKAVPGAQRVVDVEVEEVVRIDGAVPIAWDPVEPARDLRRFRAGAAGPPQGAGPPLPEAAGFERAVVTGVVDEAEDIRSFYIKPTAGGIRPFLPGQHLRVRVAGEGATVLTGHYSLSRFEAGATEYRIGVRRNPGPSDGSVSNALHDRVRPGSEIQVSEPRGTFTPGPDRSRPLVLVGAGVGVTPLLPMLQQAAASDGRRRVVFVHGARNGAEQAYASEVRRLSDAFPDVTAHFRFSRPRDVDVLGRDHDSVGRVDAELVAGLAPAGSDFFLCGPLAFMRELVAGLTGRGVAPERIRSESFGPSGAPGAAGDLGRIGAEVRFLPGGPSVRWRADSRSLLDLAEAHGLEPPHLCRAGSCGSCEHRLLAGEVAYPEAPDYPVGEGRVLLCRAQPTCDVAIALADEPGRPDHAPRIGGDH